MHEQYYKVSEVANIFNVKPYTVRAWIREGKIEAVPLPTGHYRITHDEVKRIANERYGAK